MAEIKNHWEYTTTQEKEEPYKHIIKDLQLLSEDFKFKTDSEQEQVLNEMVDKIRQINIFPIIYFNKSGIKKEILSVYNKNDICFKNGKIDSFSRKGLLLLDFLFPNLHFARTSKEKTTMYSRFYNDDFLKKCIRLFLNRGNKIVNLRTLFFSTSRFYFDTPINYNPIRAKIIYEHYCPPKGIIYDYSAGYGGRMLGALCSTHNFKYIAVDPNTFTCDNLNILGKYIEDTLNRKDSYLIYNVGSEDFQIESESIDFIFSCPPFFKKEIYSDEETQSINKFSKYGEWLQFYVRPTITNSYIALKEKGVYAVDIMDYAFGNSHYDLVKDWIQIAEEEGFVFKNKVPILSRYRNKESQEYLYLFMKNKKYSLPDYTLEKTKLEAMNTDIKNLKLKIRKEYKVIGEYNLFGELLREISYEDFEDKDILKGKRSEIRINNNYYKIYRGNDIVEKKIKVKKPICKIDDVYYYSCAEIGKQLEITRQAVSQSRQRKSLKIKNKNVIWY